MAFVGDPDKGIISDNSFISGYVNIIVGCIGALSVFISSIERLLNYKSRIAPSCRLYGRTLPVPTL